MILARELRIGNKFKGVGGIQTVLSLEENTNRGKCNYSSEDHRLMYSHLILCNENLNQYKPWEIEPIPLDEPWLNKLGFEFVEEASGYCNKNHIMVISKTDDSMIFMPFCTNDDDCYITVNYVHEVQNICFVFGEELTVSE